MLEISGLRAGYGQGDVLFDLSLRIGQSEAVCLLGRNGAGKSTTLKAIMQLVHPTAGSIRLEGTEIVGKPTHEVALAGVGYVAEDRRMFPKLGVEENLKVTRVRTGRTSEWSLDRVYTLFPKLRERRSQLAGTLSGGEQQMLAIARTLMGSPRLLLLDEPSEGLAPLIVQGLIEQIARLKNEKITILLSEQNLSFAEALCERVYIIDRGTIQYDGPLARLRTDQGLHQQLLSIGGAKA